MSLSVSNQQDKIRDLPDLEKLLQHVGSNAFREVFLPADAEIGVVLVDDQTIRQMNREYRGVDTATDVLSFALNEKGMEEPWLADPEEGRQLGDVVISVETAARQAEEFGHSLERETGYLLVHGILHLAGYDHELERGTRLMRAKEERILAAAGLAREGRPDIPRKRTGPIMGLSGEKAVGFLRDLGLEASELLEEAWSARARAYAPYSGFAVGAALLSRSGRIYPGCNVENISYSLSICAERSALSQAVLAGETVPVAIAVVAQGAGRCTPCGACRQALAEFSPDLVVITQTERGGNFRVYSLADLLPALFDF